MRKTPNISTKTGTRQTYILSPFLFNVQLEVSEQWDRRIHGVLRKEEELNYPCLWVNDSICERT